VGTARTLVSQLRGGERPDPSRGAPLCSFKQISRQIAGFFDDEAAVALEANASGVATEVGVKLAIERGESAPSYANASDGAKSGSSKTTDADQPTSSHDAPLKTAESDSDNKTDPGASKGN
jgi:NADH-quinone oxidoreductase subunit E